MLNEDLKYNEAENKIRKVSSKPFLKSDNIDNITTLAKILILEAAKSKGYKAGDIILSSHYDPEQNAITISVPLVKVGNKERENFKKYIKLILKDYVEQVNTSGSNIRSLVDCDLPLKDEKTFISDVSSQLVHLNNLTSVVKGLAQSLPQKHIPETIIIDDNNKAADDSVRVPIPVLEENEISTQINTRHPKRKQPIINNNDDEEEEEEEENYFYHQTGVHDHDAQTIYQQQETIRQQQALIAQLLQKQTQPQPPTYPYGAYPVCGNGMMMQQPMGYGGVPVGNGMSFQLGYQPQTVVSYPPAAAAAAVPYPGQGDGMMVQPQQLYNNQPPVTSSDPFTLVHNTIVNGLNIGNGRGAFKRV